MYELKLNIIPQNLLPSFKKQFNQNIFKTFESLADSELSIETFNFYRSVSAVFSSKIEGEEIEMDSYIKHKRFGIKFLPDYTRKVDDLYDAYSYGQSNTLNIKAVKKAHALLTKHILVKESQGNFRKGLMHVVTPEGKIEYAAAAPELVETEMNQYDQDLALLLRSNLSFEEVLFFGSMLHLVFLKIHPFEDGNGRSARLLKKWFIASKLGSNAWFINTEKYYYEHKDDYYGSIRALGIEYSDLNYDNSMPFLKLLLRSIDKT